MLHRSCAESWRQLFLAAAVVGVVLSRTSAVGDYVRSRPFDVVQPNGTCLRLLVTGDEHYRWVHDEKGRVILRDTETGLATYAIKVDGNVVPGPALVGVDDPDALGIEPNLTPDPGHFPVSPYANQPSPSKGRSVLGAGKPDFERINNLVIFVRFAGESEFPASRSISVYDASFFNGTASTPTLKSYFLEASYKKTTIDSTFYPTPGRDGLVVSYQDSHKRGYFQEFSGTNPDGYKSYDERAAREWNLVASAVNFITPQVPADLDIDTNVDGNVDGVVLVVNGEADGWNSLLWPHKWQLGEPFTNTKIKGKRVYTYNFEPDRGPAGLNVGTLSHEFFHTLGAPDLYHYSSCRIAPPDIDPVRSWDLMNTHESTPTHMGAHMKWKYGGFIDSIPWITASGTYTLSPLTSSSGAAYRIASPYSKDEYYVLEYRRKAGLFESSVPGEGLLVTRIDKRLDGNDCGSPDEVYVFRPGGTPALAGEIDKAPLSAGSGRTGIGETTDPVPFLRDGSSGGLAISEVGAAGNTISFHIDIQAGPCLGQLNLTAPADGGQVTGTTVALSWAPTAGATSYDVYFGTSINLTEPSNLTTTSTSRTVEPDTDYYWKVVARGAGACSRSSAVQTFRTTNGVTTLTKDVAGKVTDGKKDSWQFFSIDVPPGVKTLTITASGGQGAVDLYVRYGQLPYNPPYDWSPTNPGSNEKCVLSSPWAGTFYVLVHGATAHSGFSLVATWSGHAVATTPLAKNVPVKIADSVEGNVRYFTVAVPLGASNLSFRVSGGTGNADLTSRYLAVPMPDLPDLNACSSTASANIEACAVPTPFQGTYYLAVKATKAYAGVALVANWVNATDSFTCTPNATTMCLGAGGRFKVQADYKDHAGDVGRGKVNRLTDLSGYLYFSDPSNVELVAKFVSFCNGTTGNWAVYVSGLTDLEVTFKVTDTKTGLYKEYKNALGNLFCTIGDGPFSCPAGIVTNAGEEDLLKEQANRKAAALLAGLGDGPAPERWVGTPATGKPGAWNAVVPLSRLPGEDVVDLPFDVAGSPSLCAPDATTMCLGTDGRFKVQADYRDYGGNVGQGKVNKLTDLSGYLYFSDASNVELVAKFVSFCDGHSGNWAIYASGLTDVEVTFKVTDTKNGLYKEYKNALGNKFCTVRDGPFACP